MYPAPFMVVYSIEVAAIGVVGIGATRTAGVIGAGAGAFEVVAAVAVVVVGPGFAAAGFGAVRFVFGLARSGNSFGATTAHNQRKAIEAKTAMKIRFSISRDGVPTSRVQHMTTGEPPHSEPAAAQKAIPFDRLHHVHRARRLEAAHRREQRWEESLVKAKQGDGDRTHER